MQCSIKHLHKAYGNKIVLDNLSLDLPENEIVGLVGKNASGKTTLMQILASALEYDAGQVTFNGEDMINNLFSYREKLGYVPQNIALFDELTVKENLISWSKHSYPTTLELIDPLVKRLNLEAVLHQKVSRLSGGMQRLVNFAVSLLTEASFYILDEPFVGIDIENMRVVEKEILTMAKNGASILISSHEIEQLLRLADRIIILAGGKIVYDQAKQDFIQEAKDVGVHHLLNDYMKG
ncbi:MAG TPA: ABC transporter ATP-binding protein [Erysipelothrix sp.]|nr:ABC transporter ATP-binding protein [Erysipelothrix sp.]